MKQFLSYVSGAPFQPAVARALNEGDEWVEKARLDLQDRRDQFAAGLAVSRARTDRAAWHVLHDHRCPAAGLHRRRASSAESCQPAAESSRFRIRCSTTAPRRGDRTCGGLSASRSRCWTKRSADWAPCASMCPELVEGHTDGHGQRAVQQAAPRLRRLLGIVVAERHRVGKQLPQPCTMQHAVRKRWAFPLGRRSRRTAAVSRRPQ